VTESGPDHEKTFEAAVRLGGSIFGTGSGRSKKEAEQQAAEEAWTRIREAVDASLVVEYPGAPTADTLVDVDETASSAD
jgi:ribonuclease III